MSTGDGTAEASEGPPSPEAPAAPSRGRLGVLWQRARTWFAREGHYPFAVFALTRFALLACSAMGLRMLPVLFYHPEARHPILEPYPALDGLCRWDCGWFDRIVKEGYSTAENAKVFPLFPLIGWSLEKLTGVDHLVIFLIVANLASLASYVVIFRLFKRIEGEEAARCALLLLATFPWAFYQAAGYPESLMMLLTAVAVSLAMSGKHIRAGVVLGLGVMTRHVALFYGPALLVAQIRERGLHPRRLLLNPAVLGLLAPFAFVGLFMWHLQVRVGDPLAFWNARTIGWGEMVWYGAGDILRKIPYWDRPELYYMLIIGLIPWAGALLLGTRKRWIELASAAIASMLIFYSSGAATGLGRYTASVWPAFLPLGAWLCRRPALVGPVVGCLAIAQGLMFFLFTHQWRVI